MKLLLLPTLLYLTTVPLSSGWMRPRLGGRDPTFSRFGRSGGSWGDLPTWVEEGGLDPEDYADYDDYARAVVSDNLQKRNLASLHIPDKRNLGSLHGGKRGGSWFLRS